MARRWIPRLVLAVALARPAAVGADPAPLDQLVEQAADAGKPLVVIVGAAWCSPCRQLEAIEHEPEVERALAGVIYAHYDLDSPAGGDVADRFGVRAVPTLIVFDARGHVARMESGVPGGRGAMTRWFLQFLDDAVNRRTVLTPLEQRAAARPQDLGLRMQLAQTYQASDRLDEAEAAYQEIARATGYTADDRIAIAAASAAAYDIGSARARRVADLADAMAFVERAAGSPEAGLQLAVLVVARDAPRDRVRELLGRHIDAVAAADTDPVDAVRLAILAREPLLARPLVAAGGDSRARLLRAELDLADGQRERAEAAITDACGGARRDPLHCHAMEVAIATGRKPGIERLRRLGRAALDEVTHGRSPPAVTYPLTAPVPPGSFSDALAAAIRRAGRPCGGAGAPLAIDVELRVDAGGGLHVGGDDSTSRRCVARQLVEVMLPAPPAGAPLVVEATVLLGAPALDRHGRPRHRAP